MQEMLKALDDANGVIEEVWIRILNAVGDKDPSVQGVSCFGGRYYVTEMQRTRLRHMIPFLQGTDIGNVIGTQLLLPAHVEQGPLRCNKCKGPYHPATGHAFSQTIVACHVCYGRFAAWQMKKYGWQPLTPKQLKKLDKKKAKAAKKAEKAAKALEKQLVKEKAEHERIYGKPRDAQPAQPQNPILER